MHVYKNASRDLGLCLILVDSFQNFLDEAPNPRRSRAFRCSGVHGTPPQKSPQYYIPWLTMLAMEITELVQIYSR
jgi:hypothetical protein